MPDPLEPAYLLTGTDRAKVMRAVRRLRDRVEGEGGVVEAFDVPALGRDAIAAAAADVAAACARLDLLSSARLVVVDGADRFVKADVETCVVPFLAAPPPDVVLALVATARTKAGPSRLPPAHPLQAHFRGKPRRLEFDLPTRRELPQFVRDHARQAGVRLDPAAQRRLLDLLRKRPDAVDTELDKLATWAAGEPVTAEDVDALVAAPAGDAPWDFLDAVAARERQAAFRHLGRAYRGGGTPQGLVTLLVARIADLGAARRALAEDVPEKAVQRERRMADWQAERLVEGARRWTDGEVARATVRVAQLEHEVKGGLPGDAALALERVLAELV